MTKVVSDPLSKNETFHRDIITATFLQIEIWFQIQKFKDSVCFTDNSHIKETFI